MHVHTCVNCSTSWFPAKLRCPRCGGGEFTPTSVAAVDVEEVTVDPRRETWLATVRADAGPRLIARVPAGTPAGARLPVVDSAAAAVAGAGAFVG